MMFKNILQTKPQPLLLVSLNDANTFRERTAKLRRRSLQIVHTKDKHFIAHKKCQM